MIYEECRLVVDYEFGDKYQRHSGMNNRVINLEGVNTKGILTASIYMKVYCEFEVFFSA